MNGRSIVWASVAMAAVLAVVSALKYDFMTVAVAILYAAVLLYPLRRVCYRVKHGLRGAARRLARR